MLLQIDKTLLIDLDPQGNLSTGIGISEIEREISVYDVITRDISLNKTILTTKIPNLKIVPSNPNLSGIEFELAADENRADKLNNKFYYKSKAINSVDLLCSWQFTVNINYVCYPSYNFGC